MKAASSIGFMLVLCLSAHAGEDEKLLFGFEKEECERVGAALKVKNAFRVAENGDVFLKLPQSTQGWNLFAGVTPMECVKQDPTQGQFCMQVPNSSARALNMFFVNAPSADFPELEANPSVNVRLPEVFNTYRWFAKAFPADWSGYDLLRIDVRVARERPVTLLVEVEDDLVEPPVSQTYADIKPGKWVTLELNLAQAAVDRGLNLSRMRGVFVRFDHRGESKGKNNAERAKLGDFTIYLDNIRLAKKDAACGLEIVRGERSFYTRNLPRSYAVEIAWDQPLGRSPKARVVPQTMPMPARVETGTARFELSSPAVIDLPPFFQRSLVSGGKSGGAEKADDSVYLKGGDGSKWRGGARGVLLLGRRNEV